MRMRRFGWRLVFLGCGSVAALTATVVVAFPSTYEPLFRQRYRREAVATAVVRRTDLSVALTTGGRVDSSNRTTIECELEAMDVSVRGRGAVAGGASTILSVIPDGSSVKSGDVLAVLDSSDYEELVRTQQMNVDRSRADQSQAVLNLEVARMAVQQYRNGLMLQTLRTMEGQIALSKSDYARTSDRLEWSRKMLEKGYLPKSQISTEEFQRAQQALNLTKSLTTLRLFKRFSAPMYLRILESDVLGAEATLSFQERRFQRNEERLDKLKRQVERCTIRAPHDGFVIYATQPNQQVRIEEGMSVRQKQRLFYLPDLSQMEVAAMLHESVVKEVKPGMLARIKIEALSGRVLEGHVVSVSQLPVVTPSSIFSDVKFFEGIVRLDTIPRGLRPGMTAEVEIKTVRRSDVLAVPAVALTIEKGHDVCYVAHDEGIERREVKLGESTRDMLEVVAGLEEGEEVVLDPTHVTAPVEVAASDPFHDAGAGEPVRAHGQ